jgi:hypothetical protein
MNTQILPAEPLMTKKSASREADFSLFYQD